MRRGLWILAWSATFAAPTVSRAQVDPFGGAIAIGYGALIVTAATRLVRGPGSADLRAGSQVRLHLANGEIQGRLLSVSADSLVVETPSGTRALADADVRELRVSVGPRSRWAQGFLFGLGVGAGAGAAFGFADGDDPPGNFLALDAGEKALLGGAFFGILGSMVGSIVGHSTPREAWAHGRRPVTGVSLQVAPVVGPRVGIAGQLRF